MKNVGIHVLDFNDNIIDFISQSDGALINAEMSMNVEEKTETFDFTIENTRAEKLRERNRIIAQDNNGTFREFIIIHIADNFDGTTEIECNASYLEDLKTAKPIKPGKFEAHTTTQALLKTLADTGWEVSDDTEYGGNRTTSWTSHTNPFDLIYMLCTTYDMVPSFYIELGAHTVEHRYVSITKPKNLFKGKEITKGKDLTGMTRTIDLSEVKTALLAVGPEKEDGSRIETVVVDDEAQEIFGLPNRYIWDVYEPESNDENMTLERLTTLAKTELNKRNQAAISYEVSSLDIHKYYNDVTVHLRDIVRVKDRDFRPPLYIEAEVIGIKYNWLADESEFTFGNVIEYEETKLREFFNKRLDEITKKLNDNISNVNTIVSDVVAGELEYYERKIFKGAEPPENPQNDMLWYDTSNPDVAVLRRYWNGEWITQTADDVEKIGGLRREQVMYRDLNNSFINLTIQHSKLQNDVYDVLNSEYLVDDDLKTNLNQALLDLDSVYQNIKTNLDSMDEDTATIGKLVDTQTLFTVYREKLQTLYKYVTEAKISIDRRLKLLQSQYTDEKFNEALTKVANKFGLTVDGNNNMIGTPDVVEKAIEASRIDTQEQLKSYVKSVDYETDKNGIVERLDSADSERKQLSNEITDKVTLTKFESGISDAKNYTDNIKKETENYTDNQINNLDVGSENLLLDSEKRNDFSTYPGYIYIKYDLTRPLEIGKTYSVKADIVTTDERQSGKTSVYPYNPSGTRDTVDIKDGKITYTFTAKVESTEFLIYKDVAGQSNVDLDVTIEKAILVEGDKVTGWSPANQDVKKNIQQAETNAKAYTDDYKNKNEIAMTKLETSITQNGDKIALKVDEQKFNASRKTLSQVISEISATTKGINLSYDENGNIQSYTMDRNGIQLRGDKVDITVNKDFNVMASKVDDKVGKNEIINRLNLSPEGLDINVNNIGIRGGDNVDYLDIRNNSILSYGSFTRTWANETDTANLRLGIQGGTVKVQNRTTGYNLYLTEKGLSTMLAGAGDETAGTLEFHSKKYNDTSRGVRLHSTYGAVALESDYSRIILNSNLTANIESNTASVYIRPMKNNRKGTNEFRFWTKLNDTEAETDGVLSYGSLTELPDGSVDGYSFGSSIRFEKNPKSNTIYATDASGKAGTGNFYALNFIGDLWARNSNIYAQVDNEFRITDRLGYNGGTPNYKNLRVNSINTISSYAFSNHSGRDTYFGVGGGELIITNNNHYNGGNTSYRNIRFGKWYAMSSEKYKYDIKEWDYSVLDAYRNDLKLYSYKYKSEEDSKYIRNHHGVIIERELPIEWRHGDGFDGNEVMFWNTKAIQELIKKVDKLEEQLNEQSITS
ncbi:phage tail spike protein [Staphylococcus hominis]|uniref:Peptidase S74 domain-containing protein n=1 Tax=Staphylococcus hominis TaxID=1290 RepID=A0A974KYS3_STAHO|nr:phage tail spike protein [Staphylococcus hominis]PTK32209.1 hypothetical protein BUZ51_00040 [Staphylococcus hominis]RIO59935.1 hypothetical protein BUZ49_00835 [Staphylococcus hominis]